MITVLAHGVFDWVHHGHLEHLEQARAMGDRLIVSVVADALVDKGRLIQDERWRVKMLQALRCVDLVVLSRDAMPPLTVMCEYEPQIYVRGPDYVGAWRPDIRAAAELGIKVAYTTSSLGVSTTKLKEAQRAICQPSGNMVRETPRT